MSYATKEFDNRVVKLLKRGAIGFMPSDTIYGLSCRALDQLAVEKIHKLKDRRSNQPYIVLIANVGMLDLLSIDKAQTKPAQKYWPGSLTFECQAPNAPAWLHRGQKYFGVRIPNNKALLELIEKVGPIISTSANKQGEEPAKTYQAAKQIFGEELDFYVDIGPLGGQPSTLVRAKNDQLEVIRQGVVKVDS